MLIVIEVSTNQPNQKKSQVKYLTKYTIQTKLMKKKLDRRSYDY